MMKFGVGQAVPRFEDARLLRGQGKFLDDINLPNQLYTVFLRSPHAHARIRKVDTSVAAEAPGVVAVYTGADYNADGLGHAEGDDAAQKGRRLADVRAAAAGAGDRSGALCRRSGGDGRRRVAGPGEGRGRTGRGRLRAAAGGHVRSPRRRSPTRRASGTTTRTTSRTSSSAANKAQRPRPPLPAPRTSSSAATSSPACTRSTWSRAAPSAFTITATGPLHAPRRLQLPAPRAQHAGRSGLQGAGEPGARRHATMSAAVSAPRAGSMSSTGWCCGRRASSAGR